MTSFKKKKNVVAQPEFSGDSDNDEPGDLSSFEIPNEGSTIPPAKHNKTVIKVEVPSFYGDSFNKLDLEVNLDHQDILVKDYGFRIPIRINPLTGIIESLEYPANFDQQPSTSNLNEKDSLSRKSPTLSCPESMDSAVLSAELSQFYAKSTVWSVPGWVREHDYCRSALRSGKPFLLEELQRAVYTLNTSICARMPLPVEFTVSNEDKNLLLKNLVSTQCSKSQEKDQATVIPKSATYQKNYDPLILNDLSYSEPVKWTKNPSKNFGKRPNTEEQISVAVAQEFHVSASEETRCVEAPYAPIMCRLTKEKIQEHKKHAKHIDRKQLKKLAPNISMGKVEIVSIQANNEDTDLSETIKQEIALKALDEMKKGFQKRTTVNLAASLPEVSVYEEKNLSGDPFKCKICEQSFTRISSLKSHYKSHAGIKPFECEVCQQKFTRKHSLNYHMACHTGETRFLCPWCNKVFRHVGHFKDHVRVHKSQPFICPECGFEFRNRMTLRRHVALSHKKSGRAMVTKSSNLSVDPGPSLDPEKNSRNSTEMTNKLTESSVAQGPSVVFLRAEDVGQNLIAGSSFNDDVITNGPLENIVERSSLSNKVTTKKSISKQSIATDKIGIIIQPPKMPTMKLLPFEGAVIMPQKLEKAKNVNNLVVFTPDSESGDWSVSKMLNADWLEKNRDAGRTSADKKCVKSADKDNLNLCNSTGNFTAKEEERLDGNQLELKDYNVILVPPQ